MREMVRINFGGRAADGEYVLEKRARRAAQQLFLHSRHLQHMPW